MSLQKRGLHTLLTDRNKGLAAKGASGSQPPSAPLLPLTLSVNLFVVPHLKKKRKEKEVFEEGEMDFYEEAVPSKLLKMALVKGKGKASSAESREYQTLA